MMLASIEESIDLRLCCCAT